MRLYQFYGAIELWAWWTEIGDVARAEGIVADASAHPFPPDSFDLAFSRFGIMFFSDPVAAFANVRRGMKPGGRLTLAVFRPASEKLWPNAPLEAVRHLLPPIPTPGPEEPGPFSGPIQRACIGYWKAPGSVRFH